MDTLKILGVAMTFAALILLDGPANSVVQGAPPSPPAPFAPQRFEASTTTLTNGGNPSGFGLTLETVPLGQRLTIEFVTASCSGSAGIEPQVLRITAQRDYFMKMDRFSIGANVTEKTLIFAEPGTKINLTIFPTTIDPTLFCNVSVSGFLEPQ
jgi:hypothetical protein